MEGKGDQLPMTIPIIKDGYQSKDEFYHVIINCSGRRTLPKAIEEYALKSGNYVVDLPIALEKERKKMMLDGGKKDIGAYHGNVGIAYYQDKNDERGVIYVPDMLKPDSEEFAYKTFTTLFGEDHVHPIVKNLNTKLYKDKAILNKALYYEAVGKLSMNMISTGKGRVITSKGNINTNAFLESELGLEVLSVYMTAIDLGGGGLQC